MIGFFLIVEMTDAADKRSMAVPSRPIDCFSLSFERGKHVICVVFDHINVDMGAFGAAPGSRFNIDVPHCRHLLASGSA
jgi:hypothetical protein